MSRIAKPIICTMNDIKSIDNLINNGLSPKDLVVRCKAIKLAHEGKQNKDIAKELNVRPNSVGDWRKAWQSGGIDAIINIAKTGRPRSEKRKDIEKRISEADQEGAFYSVSDLSNQSGASKSTVYRAIAETGTGCAEMDVSLFTDSMVITIVGIYISGIENAIILRCSSDDTSTPDGKLIIPSVDLPDEVQRAVSGEKTIDFQDALELLTQNSVIHSSGTDRKGMKRFVSRIVPMLPSGAGEQYHVIYYSPSGLNGIGNNALQNLHVEECDSVNMWIRETAFWIELLGNDAALAGSLSNAVRTYIESRKENSMAFQWHRYRLASLSKECDTHTAFDEDESLESIVTVTAKIENRDGTIVTANITKANCVPSASTLNYSGPTELGNSVGLLDRALGDVFRNTQKELMENYMNEAVKKTHPTPNHVK